VIVHMTPDAAAVVPTRDRDRGAGHAQIVSATKRDTYTVLSVLAPHIASASVAGQFLSVSVGDDLGMVLRRYFSILDADPNAGTIDFVVAVHNRGTAWLAHRVPGESIDVLGPLGKPFPPPPPAATILVIGGGHGSAALVRLVRERAMLGDRVHALLGAATAARLYAPEVFELAAASLRISTEDGSIGSRGSLCDQLDETIARCAPDVVYACGPMSMLAVISEQLAAHDVTTYVATEARMACGIGVCMTCVLPIIGDDGVTRMTRSCTDGPVFQADRVRWHDIGSVPTDCWGAG
jgi:dihydroorotate dehydrogenase electron transfer subunit